MSNYGKTYHYFNLADGHCPAFAYVSLNFNRVMDYLNRGCNWSFCVLFMICSRSNRLSGTIIKVDLT